jgi:hypothetical protein
MKIIQLHRLICRWIIFCSKSDSRSWEKRVSGHWFNLITQFNSIPQKYKIQQPPLVILNNDPSFPLGIHLNDYLRLQTKKQMEMWFFSIVSNQKKIFWSSTWVPSKLIEKSKILRRIFPTSLCLRIKSTKGYKNEL